jgi:hypothetical protein
LPGRRRRRRRSRQFKTANAFFTIIIIVSAVICGKIDPVPTRDENPFFFKSPAF